MYIGKGLVDTGATKCVIPKNINDTKFNLPIQYKDDVLVARENINFESVIIPKFSLFYIYQGKANFITKDNVEAWLGDTYVVGMNFQRCLNISMVNDVLTITI